MGAAASVTTNVKRRLAPQAGGAGKGQRRQRKVQRKRHPKKDKRKKKKDDGDDEDDLNFDDYKDDIDARAAAVKALPSHEFAKDMCETEDAATLQEMWLAHYFAKWESFPNEGLNTAMEKIIKQIKEQLLAQCKKKDKGGGKTKKGKIDLKKFALALNLADPETRDEVIRDKIAEACEKGFKKGLSKALNRVVAAQVARSAVAPLASKAVAAGGRRAAIVVVQQSSTLLAAQGGKAALKSLASGPVGVAAMAGELAAEALCVAFEIDDRQTKTYASAAGGIMAGIAAGAVVGGPVGAAGGAAVGAASWLVGEGVRGLMRVGHGPSDNWCYLSCGDIDDNVCAGSYAGDDGTYWKTYGHNYYRSKSQDVFSAGNDQGKKFQVCIWDKHGYDFHTWEDVYYRDTFFVSRVKGKTVVVYCKGGFNKNKPGTVERKVFW